LPKLDDPIARAVVWGSLREGLLDAKVDPETYLAAVESALPGDGDIAVESVLGGSRGGVIGALDLYFARPDDRDRMAAVVRTILDAAAAGSNRQLIATRALIHATDDVAMLQGWLDGSAPDGLVTDEDFRWRVLRRLCALGVADHDDISREQDRDPSSQGALHALRCRASLPDPDVKAEVWQALTADRERSNYELYAMAECFFTPGQTDLTRPFVRRYFDDFPGIAEFRTGVLLEQITSMAYPRYAVDDETISLAEACLAGTDLDTFVRRAVSDNTDDLRRVLRSTAAFPR
jgi:aminopeptidase N